MSPHHRVLRRSIVATLAALALGGTALGVAHASPEPRIIDGALATENPGAVIVLWKYQKDGKDAWWHQCTGSVVAPQWVLLARHCILDRQEKELNRFLVRAGSLKDEEGGETSGFTQFFKSPNSDMMLYKMTTPFTAAIKPVTLATQDPPAGSINTIYGWGGIDPSESPKVSPVLKTAEISPYEFVSRDDAGGPGIRSKRKTGVAWRADSGGPQFYNGTLVGVISTVGNDKSFMTSGSVAKNLTWIQETIKKNS